MSRYVKSTNFNDAVYLDIIPFAHPLGGSPTDILSARNYAICMESWSRNVLMPLHEHEGTSIALCSKETGKLYAKHVVDGTIKDLERIFQNDPSKIISASTDRLVLGYHPCSMYDPLHWSNMGLKTRTMDEYMTATKKSITGNDDIEECRFARSILDENSEAFALMHEKYLAGCSLGGKTTQEMRCNAGWHFNILMEDGYSREEALNWIENEMSLEHRNLYVNEERFTATSRLAAEMGRREVSESEFEKIASELDMDVSILRANVNAFRENQEQFTATSRLAAEMGRRDVSDSEC